MCAKFKPYWEFKDQIADSVDPDEVVHHEPPHLDLRYLQTSFSFRTLNVKDLSL